MQESKKFKLHRDKTTYMKCKFSNRRQEVENLVIIVVGGEVAERDQFRFLGSIIRNKGEIEEGVTNIF